MDLANMTPQEIAAQVKAEIEVHGMAASILEDDGTWTDASIPPRPFFKTDVHHRLQDVAALARKVVGIPRNYRVEVGVRDETSHFDRRPTHREMWDVENTHDLDEQIEFWYATEMDEFKAPGAIVHLYFSEPGDNGELREICVGWLGTREQPAALIDTNGTEPCWDNVRVDGADTAARLAAWTGQDDLDPEMLEKAREFDLYTVKQLSDFVDAWLRTQRHGCAFEMEA